MCRCSALDWRLDDVIARREVFVDGLQAKEEADCSGQR
jgi:hypothetical protein